MLTLPERMPELGLCVVELCVERGLLHEGSQPKLLGLYLGLCLGLCELDVRVTPALPSEAQQPLPQSTKVPGKHLVRSSAAISAGKGVFLLSICRSERAGTSKPALGMAPGAAQHPRLHEEDAAHTLVSSGPKPWRGRPSDGPLSSPRVWQTDWVLRRQS